MTWFAYFTTLLVLSVYTCTVNLLGSPGNNVSDTGWNCQQGYNWKKKIGRWKFLLTSWCFLLAPLSCCLWNSAPNCFVKALQVMYLRTILLLEIWFVKTIASITNVCLQNRETPFQQFSRRLARISGSPLHYVNYILTVLHPLLDSAFHRFSKMANINGTKKRIHRVETQTLSYVKPFVAYAHSVISSLLSFFIPRH